MCEHIHQRTITCAWHVFKIVEMPADRLYWGSQTRYPAVADVMSRNRFQLLLKVIHFVDNLEVSDEEKKDKLWKLRQFREMFRQQGLLITPGQHQSGE